MHSHVMVRGMIMIVLVSMVIARKVICVRINFKPLIYNGNAVRMAMGANPLLIPGVSGISKTEKYQKHWGGIFQNPCNLL